MDNEKPYNPCKDCILLVKCLPMYKKNIKESCWPVYNGLVKKCDLLEKQYTQYDILNKSSDSLNGIANEIDKWWKKNYGK